MTEQELREWRERLAAGVAETIRRKVHKRQIRREMGVRRDAGLRARHTAKLARRENP